MWEAAAHVSIDHKTSLSQWKYKFNPLCAHQFLVAPRCQKTHQQLWVESNRLNACMVDGSVMAATLVHIQKETHGRNQGPCLQQAWARQECQTSFGKLECIAQKLRLVYVVWNRHAPFVRSLTQSIRYKISLAQMKYYTSKTGNASWIFCPIIFNLKEHIRTILRFHLFLELLLLYSILF